LISPDVIIKAVTGHPSPPVITPDSRGEAAAIRGPRSDGGSPMPRCSRRAWPGWRQVGSGVPCV